MPELYTISSWNAQPWYNTGGTRAKKYLQGPDGKYYYFKRSQLKPGKDYKFEFWSEIIAFEIGQLLGFKVLRYDIAVDGEIMGCISQSMINPDKEELIEGIKYLQAFDNAFTPENTKLRDRYTFQLIEKALAAFHLDSFIDEIIELIVFDSIIGNSDRHQENWAFINEYSLVSKSLKQVEDEAKRRGFEKLPSFIKRIYRRFFDAGKSELNVEGTKAKLYFHKPKSPAPIYDNGSSLARELGEEKVQQLLDNGEQFQAYVNRGTSEIHWEQQKLSHFDLIRKLLNSKYKHGVKKIVERVLSRYNGTKIAQIVYGIDCLVPEELDHYKLPENRKELIVRMINARIEKLKAVGNEGI